MKNLLYLALSGWIFAYTIAPVTEVEGLTLPIAMAQPGGKIPSGSKVIGKWIEKQRVNGSFVYYQKKGQYFMRTAFPDNSFSDSEVQRKQVWNGLRLTEVDNTHGEYYILTKDGSLGFYNKEGKRFAVGQAVK